jgi:hypothetical protein
MKIKALIMALQAQQKKGIDEIEFYLDGGGWYAQLKSLGLDTNYDEDGNNAAYLVFRPMPSAEYHAIKVCEFWKQIEEGGE